MLLADTDSARVRFVREARAQAKLRHPNVVPIHFVGEAEGVSFFVMEVVEGESLASLVDKRPLDTESALDVAAAVAGALEAGNAQGLVHRDVKPSNILIETTGRVLLADFGLAKATVSPEGSESAAVAAVPSQREPGAPVLLGPPVAGLTRAGAIVGSPAYLAPEQAAGRPVDFRADIYALGITLYEALTGQTPFTAPSVPELLEAHRTQPALAPRLLSPSVSPAVEALVMRMIAKRPEDRFASYAELRVAIEEARAHPSIAAPVLLRIGASAVDAMVFLAPVMLVLFALQLTIGQKVTGVLAFPTLALVMGAVDARWGRTPGKRWMHLRTVVAFDAPLRGWRALSACPDQAWGSQP